MRQFVRTGVLALTAAVAFSDVVELKDDASIKGRIIAEKSEHVAVDVGYTILMVPRTAIAKIVTPQDEEATEERKGENTTAPASAQIAGSLYQNPGALRKESTVRELVSVLGEAVVQVRTPGGLGSGFFINEEGYLITNFHVIENETQISIEVYHNTKDGQLDRRTYKQVRIIAMNKFADLALLKVEDTEAPKFAWVLLGNTDGMSVGDRVFAIGSPLGLERTVTEGILSTKTRQLAGELYMQTTTQINPGNSGGPLFNLKGEVVGVTNMKIQFGEGLGFAIPVDSVKFFLNNRDAFAYDNDNPSNPFRYLEPPRKVLFGGKLPDGGRAAGN
jgi:serine protease Do